LPGGDPRMRLQIASRATLMFWKLPRMWMRVSASTMRVRVAFSIVNLVLPLWGGCVGRNRVLIEFIDEWMEMAETDVLGKLVEVPRSSR
jgi:hypothetical protein